MVTGSYVGPGGGGATFALAGRFDFEGGEGRSRSRDESPFSPFSEAMVRFWAGLHRDRHTLQVSHHHKQAREVAREILPNV